MNLPGIEENIYINRKSDWILALDENELREQAVSPFMLNVWLSMNDKIRPFVRWLDRYTYTLPTKMFISLAWSIIPKIQRMPFRKYIVRNTEEEEFKFILDRVRKHFKLSDNDFNSMKGRLIANIKKDMPNWFSYYGIPKRYWKKYYQDFRLIKEFGKKNSTVEKGLSAWGI